MGLLKSFYEAIVSFVYFEFIRDLRNDPKDREWLILQLEGAHLEARRENERHLSELRSYSKFYWPKFEPAFVAMLESERRKLEAEHEAKRVAEEMAKLRTLELQESAV